MFSYEICEIFKRTYFEEYLPADASTNGRQQESHALLRKKNESYVLNLSQGQWVLYEIRNYFLIRQTKITLFISFWQLGRKNKWLLFRNYLSGKLQPPQVFCTSRSSRCKTRSSRKTICANDIQRFFRDIYTACSTWNFWIKNWQELDLRYSPSRCHSLSFLFFFFFIFSLFLLFFVIFFLTEYREVACFTEEHATYTNKFSSIM